MTKWKACIAAFVVALLSLLAGCGDNTDHSAEQYNADHSIYQKNNNAERPRGMRGFPPGHPLSTDAGPADHHPSGRFESGNDQVIYDMDGES